jgi:tetratricopeptide (TPR) repeat protein
MQERLDAEATSRLMARVQQILSTAVVEHGGRVVKSTGDGVMAVFGVPVLREDDAVRAVRAGVAMQIAFASLGLADVELRVGVNTGEVVVFPDSDDVVGDPVNVAARLEAAAGLGEVLVGPETQRLVRDVIALEPVAPLTLKGKSEPVAAARVATRGTTQTPTATAFLGREADLAALIAVLEDAVATSSTRLVTLLGWPGLGKSRLAAEFAGRVADRASVVEARFVAAGGTSFGPIVDALYRAADLGVLDLGDDGERVRSTIDALLTGAAAGSTEQVFWAIRRTLEAMAAARPVVVLLDDLHWAEPSMLDLVEHLAEWLRGGAVVLLASARPELRDLRPTLLDATGPSASVVVLAGLDASASRQLALEVLGAEELPEGVLHRALEASEGNPLFLRELLRLLVDDGVLCRGDDGRWSLSVAVDAIELPATIHAALAARIEQLPVDERVVLQAASVIGRHFARGAVSWLLPVAVAARLDEHLASLHRRALLDPEGTWWDDERMFRFHHVLIRDAAYRRVLKEVRVEHHVRYADWLSARTGDHDDVLGHHLEQALRYRRELDEPTDPALVARAVRHLSAAGRRALDGDDLSNAASLLARALELAPGDAELLRDRCEALVSSGDVHAATSIVVQLAAAAHDERSRAVADVFGAQLAGQRTPDALRGVAARAGAAATTLAACGDDTGVAHAEAVYANALAGLGQIGACEAALDRSLAAARRAGDTRRANVVLSMAPAAALWGPSPIPRASGRCLDVIRVLRITLWAPHVEAHALRHQAVLEALRDRPDAARRMLASARGTFTDLGHRLGLLETSMYEGLVELLDSQPAAAEAPLRRAVDGFGVLGARVSGARAAALLARALLELDRVDEAEALADPLLAGDDLKASIGLLGVAAEVLARGGDHEEAVALARRAVTLAAPTDALVDHADARLTLARVLRSSGRAGEADSELAHARALYEAKGATSGVRRAGADRVESADEPVGERSEAREDRSARDPEEPRPGVDEDRARRREVRPNLATTTVARWAEAVRAGDLAAALSVYAAGYTIEEHGQHLELDYQTWASVEEDIVGAAAVEATSIASLGERHALTRVVLSWDADGAGQHAVVDHYIVARVDTHGLIVGEDTFPSSELFDAAACLLERWANDEAGRPFAGAHAGRAIAARDREELRRCYAEDAELVDHRLARVGEVRGGDVITDWMLALPAGIRLELADLYALTPGAALNRVRITSPDREEWESFIVGRYDDGGRIDRQEHFGDDQLAGAWACFDRFAASAGRGGNGPPRRRVRPNVATRRVLDWAAAAPLALQAYAPDYTIEYHDTQTMLTLAQKRASESSFDGRQQHHVELLASMGERHCLTRVRMGYDGFEGAGEAAYDRLMVTRTTEDGRDLRDDIFEAEQLGEALECLIIRWAEGEVEERERTRFLNAARTSRLYRLLSEHRWDEARTCIADAAVLREHRIGVPDAHSGDAIVDWLEVATSINEHASFQIIDVLGLTPTASLLVNRVSGEARDAEFVDDSLIVVTHDVEGRVATVDVFGLDDLARAWAAFDSVSTSPVRGAVDNAAARVTARWANAIVNGDLDAWAACPDLDRLLTEGAVDAVSTTTLATRGDRLALVDLTFHASAGPQITMLAVVEVDRSGERARRTMVFDAGELDAAVKELDDRFVALEPDAEPGLHALRVLWQGCIAGDIPVATAGFVPAAPVVDHRSTGWGDSDVAGFAARTVATIDLCDRYDGIVTEIARVEPWGLIARIEMDGHTRAGAEFTVSRLNVLTYRGGKVARLDGFEAEQSVEATACLEHARPTVVPNAALRATAQFADALCRGDLAALDALRGPGSVTVDRRPLLRNERRGASTDSHRALLEWDAVEIDVVPIATRGDRLALCRVRSRHRTGEEMELLGVVEADDEGRVPFVALYEPDQLDAAFDELDERAVGSPGGDALQPALAAVRALRDRDVDALRATYAVDAIVVDHCSAGWGVRDRDTYVATAAAALELMSELDVRIVETPAVASWGALVHGVVEGRAGDAGTSIKEEWNVIGNDQSVCAVQHAFDDRVAAEAFFGSGRLHPAVRWLDHWGDAIARADEAAITGLYTANAVFRDRRALLQGDVVGREQLVGSNLEIAASGDGLVGTTVEAIAVHGSEVGLSRLSTRHRDGSEVEALVVVEVNGQEAVHGVIFDADDLDAALAEFHAVRTRSDAGVITLVHRWVDAVHRRDRNAAAALIAADVIDDDRRPLVGGRRTGRADAIANFDAIIANGLDRVSAEVVATRGSCIALIEFQWRLEDGGEVTVLSVSECDDTRAVFTRTATFDPDQLDAAYAELDDRFESRAGRCAPVARVARSLLAAWVAGDPRAMRRCFAPTNTVIDHRRAGWESMDGDGFVRRSEALFEMSETRGSRLIEVRRLEPWGVVGRVDSVGTSSDGGAFTSSIWSTTIVEHGRIAAVHSFASDDGDAAAALLDELRPIDSPTAWADTSRDVHVFRALDGVSTRL